MDALRTCKDCGLEAFNETDLELFAKNKKSKYGYINRCLLCVADYGKQHHKDNPEYYTSKNAKAYADNIEYEKVKNANYRLTNKGKASHNASSGLRRARKLAQTSSLTPIEEKKVTLLYLIAQVVSRVTGVQMHVDHIHPLSKGGLHHPDNLRVITAEENLRKGSQIIT